MEMTITRALSQLKLLDARISRSIHNMTVATIVRKGQIPSGYESRDAFCKDASASIQKVRDLINQRAKIKNAINRSNSATTVNISGKTMTVEEAITRKNTVAKQQEAFLQNALDEFTSQSRRVQQMNDKIETQAHEKVSEILQSKDTSASEYKEMLEQYIAKHQYELITPDKLEELIVSSFDKLQDFMNNVDYALSESNAVTKIEIPE